MVLKRICSNFQFFGRVGDTSDGNFPFYALSRPNYLCCVDGIVCRIRVLYESFDQVKLRCCMMSDKFT